MPDNTDESTHIRHKFKMKFNNGTVADTGATIWDTRFPIRIDNYKINGGTTDTLSINYKSYNIAGNPTRTFGRDLFVTEFKYQPIHRINSITLPGDFSTTPDSVSIRIDTNFIQTSLELASVGWGNYTTNSVRSSNNQIYNSLRDCAGFRMFYDTPPNDNKESAFMKLDTSYKLYNFVTVDSAIFRIAPISFSAIYNGIPISNSQFDIHVKGVRSLGIPSNYPVNLCPEIVNVQSAQITSAYSEINLDTFNVTNSHGCSYKPMSFDIKNLIDYSITNHLPLLGLSISPIYNGPIENPYDSFDRFYLNFFCSPSNGNVCCNEWYSLYRPMLYVYGNLNLSDTLRFPVVKGGTIKYIYDDLNKKIDVISVRNSITNAYTKIEYSIDGFGI